MGRRSDFININRETNSSDNLAELCPTKSTLPWYSVQV